MDLVVTSSIWNQSREENKEYWPFTEYLDKAENMAM